LKELDGKHRDVLASLNEKENVVPSLKNMIEHLQSQVASHKDHVSSLLKQLESYKQPLKREQPPSSEEEEEDKPGILFIQ